MKIQKRDGRIQPFDMIKVFKSSRVAGISPQEALQIANEIKCINKDLMSGEVKSKVYQFLLKKNPDAARRYVSFKKN